MRTVAATMMMGAAAVVSSACHASCGPPPPDGFTPLFNGRDLSGWRGSLGGLPAEAQMSPDGRAAAQAIANERMRDHWRVEVEPRTGEGILVFDGQGDGLVTLREFGDFDLLIDWRIERGGDSGIYLRACPQVQIWDNPAGSGGLYNNERHPSTPTAVADAPVGSWNTFRISITGDRVTVDLNGVRVADGVVLENYWDRSRPLPTAGPIELQAHGTPLWFRRIFVRER